MKCYRLYTEDKNGIRAIVKDYFDDFTTICCAGFYKGKGEASVIIEIIDKDDGDVRLRLHQLARTICCANDQEEVLITESDVTVTRVGQSGILGRE